MAKKEKKVLLDESGTLIHKSDNIKVYKEPNGKLYFESNDPILVNPFMSDDYVESVSALMRLPNLTNENKLWNIIINDQYRYDININKTLYWLSGGDKEWMVMDNYIFKWGEVSSMFINKFEDVVLDIISNSYTLNDIRKGFMKKLNLPIIYEFALSNKLIK